MSRTWLTLVVPLLAASAARAAPPAAAPVLPPELPWSGPSRGLVVPPGDAWITPSEASALQRTPRYDDTVAWLRRLCAAAPELDMQSLGQSPEGREVWMVVATRAPGFTPAALRAHGKPVLLAQAGIHAGEIDGKDAGLMLLRDLTVRGTQSPLLDVASLLFIPILNVDGHERFSAHARINQRGPVEAGWRTTARNLNLNRDYSKLDAPEMQALVRALADWDPDLYLDLHVTDGLDYQYDITWGYNGAHGHSPASAAWLARELDPILERDLRAQGHVPGPLVWPVQGEDLEGGNLTWTATPRFSNGYGDARHLPTVLVENHSLKPYPQRVLATYVLLASTLRALGERGEALRQAVRQDRSRRPARVTLEWRAPPGPHPQRDILGVESRRVPSPVAGGTRIEWTGRPVTLRVPDVRQTADSLAVQRPAAYWIPAAWADVAERLAWHGVTMQRLDAPRDVDVDMDRVTSVRLDAQPFEGRVRVQAAEFAVERRRRRFAPGSVRVPTDQPLGTLAVHLLDPRGPDSFFAWGFFHSILQATEYVEAYVLDPTAERMLAASPQLRREFERALQDSAFAADARARRWWFYRRTPFFDAEWRLVPVGRER